MALSPQALVERLGSSLYAGVPCSSLATLIDHVAKAPGLRYVPSTNEGDAVAFAAGAALGGQPTVVLMQNAGLGNAVNPLSSLCAVSELPVLLLVSLRGEPGRADEPQHRLMGEVTTPLLELLQIPHAVLPADDAAAAPVLENARRHLREQHRPYALLVRPGTFAACPVVDPASSLPSRRDYLLALKSATTARDLLVATTGYTSRELEALGDHDNQFYVVGAMGCASSLALGLAQAQPQRRVIILDGDGAALMRLGALSTIGALGPANLLHLVLDNASYESTGGQTTTTSTTDLPAIARACGYPDVQRIDDPAALAASLSTSTLAFRHLPTRSTPTLRLPRPALSPPEVALRLQRHLGVSS